MATEAIVQARKWGNSLGIVLPKDLVQKQEIKENDTFGILVFKKNPTAQKLFGLAKGKRKMSGQEAKDMIRRDLHQIQ